MEKLMTHDNQTAVSDMTVEMNGAGSSAPVSYTHLPPVPTLFLLFIGYKIGSVLGMILAVPVGIVVLNMYEAGLFETTQNSLSLIHI